MSPDTALAICRFLHDASAMFVWGASVYLVTLVPGNLADDIGRCLRHFTAITLALAVATTVAALPLETAFIGDGWSEALSPAMIHDVVFATSVGQAWQLQAIAALALVATLGVRPPHRRVATALASGLLLASIALTGHAVMQAHWVGVAHRLNDAAHVLCGGAWLGALVPLRFTLRALDEPTARNEAATALRRFSRTGHVIVALVIASGVANTFLVLGRWPTDWSSPYQAMLASKIALVAMMVGLAALNRYGLVPRIGGYGSRAVLAMRVTTIAEIILGIGVVGLVSVLGMLDPI